MDDVNINMCSDQNSPLLHQYLETLSATSLRAA